MPKLGTPLFTLVAPEGIGWPMAALRCNVKIGRTKAHELVDTAMKVAEDQNIVEHIDEKYYGGSLFIILTFHESTVQSEEMRLTALGVIETIVSETRAFMAEREAAMAEHPSRERKRVRTR